jgi:RNA polymerase sigma factor (sigma-70 family)
MAARQRDRAPGGWRSRARSSRLCDGIRHTGVRTNGDRTWEARQFEEHRAHLRAVAYRMLGSLTEADDAVQEAWLRLDRAGDERIQNLRGWLTTVVGRVCIDMLRARKSRHEDLVGEWLPEPVISASDDADDPEQQALLADSVGLALLVVLEMLSPAERLAFVLHDMFAVPFDEIAPIVGRSPDTARQLASRARRRVRGAPEPDADLGTQRRVVDAFLAASRAGDFGALVALLDPDVVFRADTGGRPGIVVAHIEGAEAVAHHAVSNGSRWAKWCHPALVNGQWGLVVIAPNRPVGVVGMTVSRGRVASIDLVLDPAKVPADAARGAATDAAPGGAADAGPSGATDAPPSGAGAFGMQMFS